MKTVVIEDIRADNDYGLIVQMPGEGSVYQEDYFYWKGSSIPACFQTNRITTGIMKTWHRDLVFQKLEYHDDYEKFIFLSSERFVSQRAGCGKAARPEFCEGCTTVRGAPTRPMNPSEE